MNRNNYLGCHDIFSHIKVDKQIKCLKYLHTSNIPLWTVFFMKRPGPHGYSVNHVVYIAALIKNLTYNSYL